MLRVATGSGTILIKAEKAGIKSLAVKGFTLPTDGNGRSGFTTPVRILRSTFR